MFSYNVYFRKSITNAIVKHTVRSESEYLKSDYEHYKKFVESEVRLPIKVFLIRVK